MIELADLPGGKRIHDGLRDLGKGRLTTEALLVCVAAGSLRELGLPVPLDTPEEPDLALYESLRDHPSGDPYYHYNALRQELVSFMTCLSRARKSAGSAPR